MTSKILACLSVFIVGHTIAFAADSSLSGIVASGACLKKVSQDRGSVTLVSDALAPTSAESSQRANKDNAAMRAAVQALKLDDAILASDSYSVYEEREQSGKKMVSRGYRTQIGLKVETSQISRLGEVIVAANKLGVKNIHSLSTFVSEEKMKTEYESCLETATQNARDKALKLAKGANLKLGKAVAVVEGDLAGNDAPRNMMMKTGYAAESMAMDGGNAGPAIESKPQSLTVNVTVRFSID